METGPKPNRQLTVTPRQVSSTYVAGVAAAAIVAVNVILSYVKLLTLYRWQYLADALVLTALLSVLVLSAWLSKQGRNPLAAYILIYGLLASLVIRTLLISDLGILFAVFGALASTLVAFISLPPRAAGRTAISGYLTAAGILLLDLFGLDYRLPSNTVTSAQLPFVIGALLIAMIVVVVLQFKYLSLYIKLSAVFSLTTLITAAAVGYLGSRSLNNSLTAETETRLNTSALQVARAIESFESTQMNIINAAAGLPDFTIFIRPVSAGEQPTTADLEAINERLNAIVTGNVEYLIAFGILDSAGINAADTNIAARGQDESGQIYYERSYGQSLAYASPVTFLESGSPIITFSSPILDNITGNPVGVLRAIYSAEILGDLIARQTGMAGEQAYAVLFDENHLILANGGNPEYTYNTPIQIPINDRNRLQAENRIPPRTAAAFNLSLAEMESALNAALDVPFTIAEVDGNSNGREFFALAPVDSSAWPWTVAIVQPESVLLIPLNNQIRLITLFVMIVAVGLTLTSLVISQVLASPLDRLAGTAQELAQGNLDATAVADSEDEVGMLALAFNEMTGRLRDLIGNLETRVSERTRDLEQRSIQLQTAAEVGTIAAAERDINQLLPRITQTISQRFGFYHAGIFLLDEKSEYAVLRAANSEGGARMLARGHRLKVGETGLVGFTAGTGQARIALDVGQDAVFFDNPNLPDTRSEIALPLIASGRILGVLDVQSMEEAAFSEADISTLQVLANQVAVAIENARLFAETEAAAEATRRAYGEISQSGWSMLLKEGEKMFLSNERNPAIPVSAKPDEGIAAVLAHGQPQLSSDQKTLYMPIRIRDLNLGALRLEKKDTGWTADEVQMAETISSQISASLESARLFEDTIQRAERERLYSQVSNRIRQTLDTEIILQTAAAEIQRAFNLPEVAVHLSPPRPETGKKK